MTCYICHGLITLTYPAQSTPKPRSNSDVVTLLMVSLHPGNGTYEEYVHRECLEKAVHET
jgi:hypothetical protein